MSRVSSAQVRARAQSQNAALKAEIERLEREDRQHEADLHRLDDERDAAWRHLIEVLAPGLHPPHLDWLAGLLRLPTVSAAAVAQRFNDDRRRLEATIADVSARPEYVHRDDLLAQCGREIAGYDEQIAPLQLTLDAFRQEPAWEELHEIGYDTPRYPIKWWSFRFYRHWKAGDEIVERLGPRFRVTTFAALRTRYDDEHEAYQPLARERAAWQARRDGVLGLVRAHDEAAAALGTAPARHLALLRARVEEHLRGLAHDDAIGLVEGYPPARVAMLRIAGVDAKRRYLEGLHREWITEPLNGLEDARDKNRRQIDKLARPKHADRTFDAAVISHRYRDRSASWDKRRARYNECRERILDFERYDEYWPGRSLWWDIMVPRRDAPFLDEVAEWRRTHGARGADERFDDAVAAVAAAHLSPDDHHDVDVS